MGFYVVGKTPVRSRVGKFILGRSSQVDRAMVVRAWNTPVRPFSREHIQRVVNNGQGEVLLALSNQYLPAELLACVEASGLIEDLRANAEQVVFCTQVASETEGPLRQSQGFIIETQPATGSPYGFVETEVAELTGQQFIPAPEKAVFLNANYSYNSFAAASLAHFPTLAYFLAYKRAAAELEARGFKPASASHAFCSFYAKIGQLQAIKRLEGRSIPGQVMTAKQEDLKLLTEHVKERIRAAHSLLDHQDVYLVNEINLLERIVSSAS